MIVSSTHQSDSRWHPARFVALGVIVFLLGGCSWFTWLPWVDGEEEVDETKPMELVDFTPELRIQRSWKSSVGEGLGRKYVRLSPAIVADRVIAADAYGLVSAFDRFSGKRVWSEKIQEVGGGFFSSINFLDRRDPSFVGGGVGVGAGMAFVGTTFGDVVALNVSDGSEAWRVNLGSEVLSTPTTGDGAVFAQTIDGRLLALEATDGSLRWTFDNQVPILTLRGTSSPVVADGIVYAGFANGKISALRTENGEPIWEHRVMLPEGRSELERMVDVDGRPLVSGGVVFVGSFQGRVKGVSRRDGRPLWEQEISTFLDLAEGYDQVYTVGADDVISAIDQASGEIIWTQENFQRRGLTAPIAFSNYLAFADDAGYLHIIAQRDGRMMGRRKIDGDGVRGNLLYQDSTLFVQDNSGGLHALTLERR